MADEHVINKGLEGVYFTESAICKVDGQAGKLYYRGYSIEELSKNSNFSEVAFLLLHGRLPNSREMLEFNQSMAKERGLPEGMVSYIKENAQKMHPMDVLRTCVSMLPAYDTEAYDSSPEANFRKSVRIISKSASIVAAIGRARANKNYVAPDPSLGHAENFLYMLNGEKPRPEMVKILDIMLILHAEHSSNASTFGVIVAGSTLADLYAAITAGVAVLKGPLHGGADEAALSMMYSIGKPENTEKYIEDALAGKQKIMGFGHRVYKTYDPRARIVRDYLESLQANNSDELKTLSQIAVRAEKLMIDKLGASKGIWPNIDFFSGPVYISIGIPKELFTPLFAVARTSGWCAHMLEYWQNNRLLRPLEQYTGQLDLPYVEIGKR